jgi:CheY-like chemotaxis protein
MTGLRQTVAGSPVLVVEDHDDTRAMVATLLQAEGFTVVTAENGERGLEGLMRARPCLVLLDLMMPVMTGWEFRRVQMSLPDDELASVPVLLLTAVPDPERAAADLHAADVIPKPLDFDRLLECVRRHCLPPA